MKKTSYQNKPFHKRHPRPVRPVRETAGTEDGYARLLQAVPAGQEGITFSKLKKLLQIRSDQGLERLTERALREGTLVRKEGRFYRTEKRPLREQKGLSAGRRPTVRDESGLLAAKIVRLKKTFAFAAPVGAEPGTPDVFIPGSKLNGALPGDEVLLRLHRGEEGQLDDGEVVRITKPCDPVFAGVVRRIDRQTVVEIPALGMPVLLYNTEVADGDQVRVRLDRGGQKGRVRHREMTASVLQNYGNSEIAAHCAASILDAAGITPEFPADVLVEAGYLAGRGAASLSAEEEESRLDLRSRCIFTIDSAESKDLDDAISLQPLDNGWQLGVHIADVSHYVRPGSALDREAFRRGTSVYYADQVVPMLPKELSNGICSLNPGEDRLAFSAILTLSSDGELVDFDFRKSIIRSRVKGVYSEINRLIDGSAGPELLEKYADILPVLPEMVKLTRLREKLRAKRGTPDIDTVESKLILDEAGRCVGVRRRERGFSEGMIEEFMLLANEAAATLGRMLDIPFVYRVHEKPDGKKLDTLRGILKILGEDTSRLKGEVPASALREILENAADKPYRTLLHRQVLRSMMKAKYDPRPLGHYGLVLDNYAHFTSPIRRYPDLAIHRILGTLLELSRDYRLSTAAGAKLERSYRSFVNEAAAHSSETELNAQQAERDCEDCYKAEYMKEHLGERFAGVISGVTAYGFYVELLDGEGLSTGIEGLVRIESLPEGSYAFDEMMSLTEVYSHTTYRTGDPVEVRCVRASVCDGQVDLAVVSSQSAVGSWQLAVGSSQ